MSKTFDEMAEEIGSFIEELGREIDDAAKHNREEIAKFACEEYGLLKLPRDKDGKPIRIGDKLTGGKKRVTVNHMTLDSDGAWSLYSEPCGGYIGCGAVWQLAPELDPLVDILKEAVKRAHDDTVDGKEGTDVTDLLERMRGLMGGSDD